MRAIEVRDEERDADSVVQGRISHGEISDREIPGRKIPGLGTSSEGVNWAAEILVIVLVALGLASVQFLIGPQLLIP